MAALKAFVVGLLTTEPALVVGTTVAVVGAVAGSFGLVIPAVGLTTVVTYVVTVLGAALVTRAKVTPVAKVPS